MLNQLKFALTTVLATGLFVALPATVRAEMDSEVQGRATEMEDSEGTLMNRGAGDRSLSADRTDMEMDMDSDDMGSMDAGDDMDAMEMRGSMDREDDMDMGRGTDYSGTPVRGLW